MVKVKKRRTWHSRFMPALIVGCVIIIVTLFFDYFSGAGIDIIASIVASVVILTHRFRHHLTMLSTVISAYVFSSILSVILVMLLTMGGVHIKLQIFIVLFLLAILLYWLDIFHPPAISFSMAFVVFVEGATSFFYVLFMAVILFIGVRAATYAFYQHLSIKDFVYEFVKAEENIIKKDERKIEREIKRI